MTSFFPGANVLHSHLNFTPSLHIIDALYGESVIIQLISINEFIYIFLIGWSGGRDELQQFIFSALPAWNSRFASKLIASTSFWHPYQLTVDNYELITGEAFCLLHSRRLSAKSTIKNRLDKQKFMLMANFLYEHVFHARRLLWHSLRCVIVVHVYRCIIHRMEYVMTCQRRCEAGRRVEVEMM